MSIASGRPERQQGGITLNSKIKRMVGLAIMTAIVVVLQLLGSFIHFGPVSISLVLIPIVVGAAIYGPAAGAYLGFVFSVVVLCQPDTSFFYGISVFGTVITVIVKGLLAGWLSGMIYNLVAGKNQLVAVFLAAVVCPIVNTGIFALGCRLFFWSEFVEMSGGDAVKFLFTVMIGFNFLAELATNLVCSPAIVRVLRAIGMK